MSTAMIDSAPAGSVLSHALLLVLVFVATFAGTAAYRRIGEKLGIVAIPNERSLHSNPVPRGGGLALALPFLAGLLFLYYAGELRPRWFLALFAGGTLIALVGFIDDVREVSPRVRIVVHILLAGFAVACMRGIPPINLGFVVVEVGLVGTLVAMVAIVWMINLFNFMDGVDGMASSGSAFFSAACALILERQGIHEISVPLALLGIACLGFLCFNWPPAKVFLGDAGSAFLGYIFAIFVTMTTATAKLSPWTWAIVLGYFLADTTTTLLLRVVTVKKWYGTHRSHAYQNLARVWRSHRRVTGLVMIGNMAWLFPLALLSVHWPRYGLPIALVAVFPIVALALRCGPLWKK